MPTPIPTLGGPITAVNSPRPARRRARRLAAFYRSRSRDQRGSQITDNLGLIVIGIMAVLAISALIGTLDTSVFNWVTTQLGLG